MVDRERRILLHTVYDLDDRYQVPGQWESPGTRGASEECTAILAQSIKDSSCMPFQGHWEPME